MNIFDGLLGYEKLMLICGFVLFVFALAAITLMIVQQRDFKSAVMLIVIAIVLMGFPGIQAIKINRDSLEVDRIRAQPVPADPVQKQEAQKVLAELEQRAQGNPQLQAKVSDGYRAIGEVDKAYSLAQTVLQQNPPAQVRATLVPVLTAKLNQVQAGASIAPIAPQGEAWTSGAPPADVTAEQETTSSSATASATTSSAPANVATAGNNPASGNVPAPPSSAARQHQIATIASQLATTGTPLPAASHVALAHAYVVLGQPAKARANVEAAKQIDPHVHINPAVLKAAAHRPPER